MAVGVTPISIVVTRGWGYPIFSAAGSGLEAQKFGPRGRDLREQELAAPVLRGAHPLRTGGRVTKCPAVETPAESPAVSQPLQPCRLRARRGSQPCSSGFFARSIFASARLALRDLFACRRAVSASAFAIAS